MIDDDDLDWLEAAESGCEPIGLPSAVGHESYVSGDPSGYRLSVRYFRDTGASSLIAKAVFGPGTQGPPGHAHGGSMAALLDEAMGAAAWMKGHRAVAAELTVRFRTMLPLGSRALVRARVMNVDGRKVYVKGALTDGQQTLFAEGEALFITLDAGRFGPPAEDASRVFGGPDLP